MVQAIPAFRARLIRVEIAERVSVPPTGVSARFIELTTDTAVSDPSTPPSLPEPR
jgi:hypothetical protein